MLIIYRNKHLRVTELFETIQIDFDTEFMTARLSFIHRLQYSPSDREKQSPAKKRKKLLMTKNVVEWYFFKNALIETVLFEYFFFYFVSAIAGLCRSSSGIPIISDPQSQYKIRATRLWPFRSFNRLSSY